MSDASLSARARGRATMARRALSTRLRVVAERMEPLPPKWALRQRVGGQWDAIGQHQFDFMVAEGLRPEHQFIEIGCGVLRGGLHFIEALAPGHYHGIDVDNVMIAGAHRELADAQLTHKAPHLRLTDQFDIGFGVGFDMGIAVSVFTHVPWNQCYLALTQLSRHLAPGGRFYATYFPGPDGPARFEPITQSYLAPATRPVVTYGDRNPYHYAANDFRLLADATGLELDVIGEWGHLRGQHMLRFTRPRG